MASNSNQSDQPGDRDVVLGGNEIAANLAPDHGAILGGETPLRRWNLMFQVQPDRFDGKYELATWQAERDRYQSENFQQIELSHANLRGSYFRRDNLRGAQLNHADFSGANFSEAILSNVDLSGANLSCTNFQGANLRSANLKHSNLQGANLSQVDLELADLRGANLGLVNLEGANIGRANFTEVQNLKADQIKTAQNWQRGNYDPLLRQQLGLDT
jgi:hypothetical protein